MDNTTDFTSGFQLTIFNSIVVVGIVLFVVLFAYDKWSRRPYEKLAAKLQGPPSYPIVGTGLEFLGSPERINAQAIKIIRDYGPEPVKLWFASMFAVVIIKPEDLQAVLNNSKALDKGSLYNIMKTFIGEGLITAPVDKWRIHRRLITPMLSYKMIDQFFPVFFENSKILVRDLKNEVGKSQPFDLWNYIIPITLNSICQNAMGYNLNNQPNIRNEFCDIVLKASELAGMRIYKPWLYPEIIYLIYLKLTGNSNVSETLHKLPRKIIKEIKERNANRILAKEKTVFNDENDRSKAFIDMILELNEQGATFSDKDIIDEVVTMMIAGSETGALVLCHCILLLAIHQDIQDKVYEEIYYVLGDYNETFTVDDMAKLVYMDQVIKETLRMYPSAPFILRKLQDDVKIGEYVLPKGTTCVISPLATHYLPELYPNPQSFNPDNFDPNNVDKRPKFSFIAFSGGPRGCIGNKYAMYSIKTVLITFLRNYSVHTDLKLIDIKSKIDTLMRSVDGFPVTIRPRRIKQ